MEPYSSTDDEKPIIDQILQALRDKEVEKAIVGFVWSVVEGMLIGGLAVIFWPVLKPLFMWLLTAWLLAPR